MNAYRFGAPDNIYDPDAASLNISIRTHSIPAWSKPAESQFSLKIDCGFKKNKNSEILQNSHSRCKDFLKSFNHNQSDFPEIIFLHIVCNNYL